MKIKMIYLIILSFFYTQNLEAQILKKLKNEINTIDKKITDANNKKNKAIIFCL